MVALDGSEKDARALPVGAALSRLAGAEIQLVRVIHAPTERLAAQAELLGLREEAVTGRSDAESTLADYASRLAADVLPQITWKVLEGEDAAGVLNRHAAETDALVVVMATRAASPAGLVLVGSVADRVVHEGPKPVVLVPPGASYLRGKRVELGNVLVPLDGSARSARALDFLLGFPHARELAYVLLEVVPPSSGREPPYAEPDEREAGIPVHPPDLVRGAEARLETIAERVRQHGAKSVEISVVEDADPARAIASSVRDLFVELIAMSTRGAGGVRRLVLGSIAEKVVRASEVPVLLLTPASLEP